MVYYAPGKWMDGLMGDYYYYYRDYEEERKWMGVERSGRGEGGLLLFLVICFRQEDNHHLAYLSLSLVW